MPQVEPDWKIVKTDRVYRSPFVIAGETAAMLAVSPARVANSSTEHSMTAHATWPIATCWTRYRRKARSGIATSRERIVSWIIYNQLNNHAQSKKK